MRALSWLLLLLSGCAAQPGEPSTAASAPAEPPPPVPAPLPGGSGCIESRELKAFVLALEAERQRARSAALASLGAPAVEHPSLFQDGIPDLQLGQLYEHDGQRFAAVAQLATTQPPRIPLVQRGNQLHPLDERPRAHPVPLLVCGNPTCPSAVPPTLPPRRWIAVPFAQTWELGPPLPLSYDFWWAQVRYDRARTCPAAAP